MKTPTTIMGLLLTIGSLASAHTIEATTNKPVLAPLENLKRLHVPIQASDEVTGVGFAVLNPAQQQELLELNHAQGKCGGFEVLEENEARSLSQAQTQLRSLRTIHNQNLSELNGPVRFEALPFRAETQAAVAEVQPQNLQSMVAWLSSFPTRNERSAEKNAHVLELKQKAEALLVNWPAGSFSVETIDHTNTQQKSLRVRLTGKTKPQEIVVIGGHHDSVSRNGAAPGADDNASGSAGVFEILRVISAKGPQDRTIEFMWYAAEESGLVGSAEIAKSYKAAQKNVVGVLQMDMTAYMGSGSNRITNITDFTSPVMQALIKQLNQHYTGLTIIDEKCGYACSDHASWHRQGYPAVVPFESLTADMDPQIHTKNDLIGLLNFDHAAQITRLSLAFALELGNLHSL
jgi:bacterial leucyl aminopeptidase